MAENLQTALEVLQLRDNGMDFIDLVRSIIARTSMDQATAKASILRLNREGKVDIDSEWIVRPASAESQECVPEEITVADAA